MPLTSNEINQLMLDELSGRPHIIAPEKTLEAKQFLAEFREDVKEIKARGGYVGIPPEVEIPNV